MTSILKHSIWIGFIISHNLGCQYYVGDYQRDYFLHQSHGRMTWNDNAYFAPEALVDDRGRQIMWAWIFDDIPDSMKNEMGWTGTFGLPRSLWVGEDETLRMAPVKELELLRLEEKQVANLQVESGIEIAPGQLGNKLMELEVNINPNEAKIFGVKVCVPENCEEETVIYYDRSDNKLKVDT